MLGYIYAFGTDLLCFIYCSIIVVVFVSISYDKQDYHFRRIFVWDGTGLGQIPKIGLRTFRGC